MANPFENDEASYFVLVNDEGRHSPWHVDVGDILFYVHHQHREGGATCP
ncbi:MbtH family NRPS accessory protein [Streptomyces sp. TG1A-60]